MDGNTATLLGSLPHVKSRANGYVHTVKSADGRTTVAEVCVGKRLTRLNFRDAVRGELVPDGVALGGRSSSWACGVNVTDDNAEALAALLAAVVGDPAAATTDEARHVQPMPDDDGAALDPDSAEAEAAADRAAAAATEAEATAGRTRGRGKRRSAATSS